MLEQKDKKPPLKTVNNYIKYSGLAFQMFSIIGVFTFVGYKIDESRASKTPIITGISSLLGVIIAIYTVLKGINKSSN